MEMRILVDILVVFGAGLDRRLGLVAHGPSQWLVASD
jgi:hypothetical protein